jgi:hypothetical protein
MKKRIPFRLLPSLNSFLAALLLDGLVGLFVG